MGVGFLYRAPLKGFYNRFCSIGALIRIGFGVYDTLIFIRKNRALGYSIL